MLGSHGIPVVGADHVREALENTARYLAWTSEKTSSLLSRS
ncbi:hypothetical protein [Streptomyces pseudoechinosporeus]